MEMKPSRGSDSAPFLARYSGACLLASALFALAALLVYGTFARHTPFGIALLAGGFLCLAAWLWGRLQSRIPQKMKQQTAPRDVSSRARSLLAFNAFASTFLLAVVLIGVNYLAARRHFTLDLTRDRSNSLSDQTRKILAKLPANLRFTYFYATSQSDPNIQNLLGAYARASSRVRVEPVSALREPSRVPPGFNGSPLVVARLENAQNGAQSGNSNGAAPQSISVLDEQNLSSSILRLIEPKARTLYFSSGHGEVAPTQLSGLQAALEAQNYTLKTLNLQVKNAAIPADCAALWILAPQVDFSASDAKILSAYAANKGRLMILLSPSRQPLPRFESLVASFGLRVQRGFVFDRAYRNPQWPVGILGDAARHPILRGVSADCVFPGSVPLQIAPKSPGLAPLFQSSAQSQAVSPDGKIAAQGPFVLAASSERGQSRALVCASATLAVGEGLALFGNKSLLLSGVNWTVGNDALVSIPPRAATQNTLQMPETAARFASLLCALVLPVLALGAGALVWWKRR